MSVPSHLKQLQAQRQTAATDDELDRINAEIDAQRGEFRKALAVMEEGLLWPRPKGVPDVNYILAVAQENLVTGNRERHEALVAFAWERVRYYGLADQFMTGNAP